MNVLREKGLKLIEIIEIYNKSFLAENVFCDFVDFGYTTTDHYSNF